MTFSPPAQPALPTLDRTFLRGWRLDVLLGALLCLLTLAVYWNVLSADYAPYDDNFELFDNPHILSFSADNLRWMFTDTGVTRRYTPLSWVTWTLVVQVGGRSSRSFHAFALGVHLLNVVLVQALLLRILRMLPSLRTLAATRPALLQGSAALAAALWAFHPLRVEVVGWATQARYGEANACAIGSLLCYLAALRSARPTPWRRPAFWASVACYAASVLFYPSTIGLALLLPLLDRYLAARPANGPREWSRLWLEKGPFLLVALLAAVMALAGRTRLDGNYHPPPSLAEFGLFPRAMQAAYVFTYYLWKPFDLAHLAPIYPDLIGFNPWALPFVLSILLVPAITLALFLLRRRYPLLLLLWAAHLLIIAPVGGYFEKPHILGDRYSYTDALPMTLLAGWALALAAERLPRRWSATLGAATLIAIAAMAVRSRAQTLVWQNTESCYLSVLDQLGDHPFAAGTRWRLAGVYLVERRYPEALEQCDLALRVDPRLAIALLYRFRALQALADEAVLRDPAAAPPLYLRAAETTDRLQAEQPNPRLLPVTALLYAQAHRPDLAAERLAQAVAADPGDPGVHLAAGEVLVRLGQPAAARRELDAAVRLDPSLAAGRDELLARWIREAATPSTTPTTTPTPSATTPTTPATPTAPAAP